MIGRRWTRVDTFVIFLLFVFGWSTGSFVTRHVTGQAHFYQEEFGPAVMVAVGRGFINPSLVPGSPLDDFLAVRRMSIDRADAAKAVEIPLDQFQQATRYLMLAFGYVWRIAGISWTAVGTVAGALCGLTVVASYAICRVWLPQPLAIVGALLMCLSPLHLQQLPNVRDYSKAPFILLALALMVGLALRPMSRRALVLLGAACGAVIGVGAGFKMDVFAMAPIAIASLILFRDRRPWTGLRDKALASAALVASLAVAASPMFLHLGARGSNGFHVIVLGYSDPFDADLGLTRPAYSILPSYDDIYLSSVLREYGLHATGTTPDYPSAGYDAAGRSYWLQIVRHFPADVATRAIGAAARVLNLPFDNPTQNFLTPASGDDSRVWALLTNQLPHRARVDAIFERLSVLDGWGVLFGVVLVAAGAAIAPRVGLFAAWIVLVTSAYASLQFSDRHVFHLQIIPILGILVPFAIVFRARSIGLGVVRRSAVVLGSVTALVVLCVVILRLYQDAHLARLFEGYIASAGTRPVASAFADTGHGTSVVPLGLDPPMLGGHRRAGYYMVEFDGEPASKTDWIDVHYAHGDTARDYSRVIPITETAGINRVFIPAYGQFPVFGFESLEVSAPLKARLRRISRVDWDAQPDLLLQLQLSGDWRRRPLYQTLRADGSKPLEEPSLFTTTAGDVSHAAWLTRLDSSETIPHASTSSVSYTRMVRVEHGRIEMDGQTDSQSAYVMEFKPVDVPPAAALLVRGLLYEGGITLGLLTQDRQWYRSVTVTRPGAFVAVVDITKAGVFTPIITNATRRDRTRNHFALDRFGVVAESSSP
jgi:hypothetical protein